ncbi:MAG: LAGLIDADG family homing endonuclease [Candidatus Nanoarchaeia archaeon]
MGKREWHIWDFPDDLYVLMSNPTRDEFFKAMYRKFGSQATYARFLNTDRNCIQGYHYARYWYKSKKPIKFTPISVLKKSFQYIDENLRKKIEGNILEIRKQEKSLINPILPIKESPALYRVIANMIGDGSASLGKTPYYSNSCKELRERFREDLKVMGNVRPYDGYLTVPTICFEKTITDLLSYVFDVRFSYPNRLPKQIFTASEECKSAFIQALFDDEGTVSTNIAIAMRSKALIQELKKLMKSLDIATGRVSRKKSDKLKDNYAIQIRANSIQRFRDVIGCYHPEKKRKLEVKLKIRERNNTRRTRPLEWTREQIMVAIAMKPRGTLELSEKLLLTLNGCYYHLNYLTLPNPEGSRLLRRASSA